MIKCLECNAKMELPNDLSCGEIIECENCGVELEIVSLKPFKFKVFEEEEK